MESNHEIGLTEDSWYSAFYQLTCYKLLNFKIRFANRNITAAQNSRIQ